MNARPLKRRHRQNPVIEEYGRALQKGRERIHVLPTDRGWAVTRPVDGHRQTFPSKAKAVQGALREAKTHGTEVYVYGKDGSVRMRRE